MIQSEVNNNQIDFSLSKNREKYIVPRIEVIDVKFSMPVIMASGGEWTQPGEEG